MLEKAYELFEKSLKENVVSMTGVEVNPEGGFKIEDEEINSLGVTAIINFSGKVNGRIMLDMEESVALGFASKITGENYKDSRDLMVLASVSEMNNIVSGSAVTEINNVDHIKLWMAPPIVFSGKDAVIAIPKLQSFSLNCTTEYGKLRYNVAFEKGGI